MMGGGTDSPAEADGLQYLGVVFQEGIDGNLNQRQVNLNRAVRAVYGPVSSWNDQLDIDPSPRPDGPAVLMSCDRLTVSQVGAGPLDQTPVELRAVGNTVVEHRDYVAYAHQVKYSQDKDLLILEGDGRSKVELIQRGQRKAHAVARMITYSRTHRILRMDDGDSVESTTRGQ